MSWEWDGAVTWAWQPARVTKWEYPSHGTNEVHAGKLRGSTSTDYFHFDCPRCKANVFGLDVELLGIRDDSSPAHPRARTILLGLNCGLCGLRDLVKLGCLESEEYQPRRLRPQSNEE